MGKYEMIVKWDPSNSHDNSQSGYTATCISTLTSWTVRSCGASTWDANSRRGTLYSVQVFDLDGDGKAEIAAKTADGTIDGTGHTIGDPSADFRYTNGYILDRAGVSDHFRRMKPARAALTTDYDPPRGNVADWGDGYGNRVDRFLAGIAYLDGEHPSLILAVDIIPVLCCCLQLS